MSPDPRVRGQLGNWMMALGNGENLKGFSGLSSLASDISETVGDVDALDTQGQKFCAPSVPLSVSTNALDTQGQKLAAIEQSRNEKQPHSQKSAERPAPAPLHQAASLGQTDASKELHNVDAQPDTGENLKGFSGLSSLASDISETVGDVDELDTQGQKLAAIEQSRNEKQPHSQKSAERPAPAPLHQVASLGQKDASKELHNVDAQPDTKDEQEQNTSDWLASLCGIIIALGIAIVAILLVTRVMPLIFPVVFTFIQAVALIFIKVVVFIPIASFMLIKAIVLMLVKVMVFIFNPNSG